jgi:RHS repeat-associated protein
MQRWSVALLALILFPTVATPQTTQVVEYYHTDAQGNVRAVTKKVDGQWRVVARYDYLPFGELFGQPSPPSQRRLFTGQERDFETGLDYFGARYFAASLGRFTTVDPGNASAALHDTQSWNAYAYGRNNPLRFIDLDGRTYQVCAVGSGCSFLSDAGWESAMGKAGGNYLLQNGNMWALVNGKWTYAGFYEHISDDPAPVTFDSFIHQTGQLSAAGLRYGSIGMGIAAGGGALGGLAVGAFGGGLGAGGLTSLAIRSVPVLPVVPSALDKLQQIGLSVQQAAQIVASPSSQRFIDTANGNNINVIRQVGDKLVRITLDPTGQRIISAGYVQARNVTNSIASGRFIAR